MGYEEGDALADDEKVAMKILRNEFKWYSRVGEYMEKTFEWSELRKDDRKLFLDAQTEMCKTRGLLCDLMDSVEIHHKDFSNHKSLINDQRAKLYNYLFEISHKVSDVALKDFFASFQPSTNSLPFPDSDSKEYKDGETSSQSDNSNITSNTEPEMITRKRKRSPGEEESVGSGVIHHPLPQPEMITKKTKRFPFVEEEEEESEGSSDIYHPLSPMVFEDGYPLFGDCVVYHDHDPSDLNYRFADDDDDDFVF